MSKSLDTGAQTDGEHVLQRPVVEQRIPKNTGASILDLPLNRILSVTSVSILVYREPPVTIAMKCTPVQRRSMILKPAVATVNDYISIVCHCCGPQ
jgi:hypothetical protein